MGVQQSCINCFSQTCPSRVTTDLVEFCEGPPKKKKSAARLENRSVSSTNKNETHDSMPSTLATEGDYEAHHSAVTPRDSNNYSADLNNDDNYRNADIDLNNDDNDRNKALMAQYEPETQRDPYEDQQQLYVEEPVETGPKMPFTLDQIVGDLEVCEEKYYRDIIFAEIDFEKAGKVELDHALLRESILHTSAITEGILETELLKHIEKGCIEFHEFLHIIREFACNRDEAVTTFYRVGEGDDLTPDETQAALSMFAIDELHTKYDQAQWHVIINSVMNTRSFANVDTFQHQCNTIARIVRLHRCQQQ